MLTFQNVKLGNHQRTHQVVFSLLGDMSQREVLYVVLKFLCSSSLALLFMAPIYTTANAINLSSRMTVACVTLWDSTRLGNTHGWVEGERQ